MVTSGNAEHNHAFSDAAGHVHVASVEGVAAYAQGAKVQVGVPQILFPRCNPVMWVARYAYRCFMEAFTWADV